ncbi:MAG: hypothetical protein ACRDRT_01860 [Pseudonocardiaceae bacterium]
MARPQTDRSRADSGWRKKRSDAGSAVPKRTNQPAPDADNTAPSDRAARVAAGRGSLAHLAPGRSLVDELIADRRAEAAAYPDAAADL